MKTDATGEPTPPPAREGDAMTGEFTAHLMCVEDVVENEIAQGCTQKSVAMTYALALRSSWPTDWKRVNAAIVARWSVSGLERIKRLAWSGKAFAARKAPHVAD